MRVRVYWNLHKDCYSVLDWAPRSRKKGRLVCHLSELMLKDAKFVVQLSGNKRVRGEKRKNVHAFIEGDWYEYSARSTFAMMGRVRYNPYQDTAFVLTQDGQEVELASEVHLSTCVTYSVEKVGPQVLVPLY